MIRFFKWVFGLLALVVLVVAGLAAQAWYYRPWSIRVFYEKITLQAMLDNPEVLTSLGFVEKFGITGHNAKLSDASIAHQQAQLNRAKLNLADLRAYPDAPAGTQERLSQRVMADFLGRIVEGERWQFHNYPVNQLFGVQNNVPSFLAGQHPLRSESDCGYYLQRLAGVSVKFEQTLEGLREREKRGILPPRFVVERVLKEMGDFVALAPAENVLAKSFRERAAKIKDLPEARRTELAGQVERAVHDQVYPAYRKLIAYFEALLPKTTTDDGAWKLPDGAEFYAYALRFATTTNMDPGAVHQMGLAEVERIEGDMRKILEGLGYSGRTPGEWMKELGKDPKYLPFANSDEGRAAAIAEYTRIIKDSQERSKKLFGLQPTAPVEVKRVPEFKETTAPGAYYEPATFDGTRPGVFFANLRDMGEITKFGMRTLAYHEAVPGHHFQIAIARDLKGLPLFRKVLPFIAYAEGWALYTEWLAKDAGWYEGDPLGDLGRLQAELFRAVRLVVDTGIHAQRWTRQQAIDYMLSKTGMGEKDVTAEIERYIVWPGQACSYKLGMLKIQELRRRAEQALGTKFDLPAFHDVLLRSGSLPLNLLEEEVDAWVKQQRG